MNVGHSTAVGRDHAPAARPSADPQRGAGPPVLRARRAMRPGSRLAGRPVIAFVAVAVAGFVLLAAATVLVGWLLKTYALPEHGVGHADEHVNVWLAHHRDSTRNDVSFWLSGIGDVYAIPALVTVTAIAAMIMRRWRVAGFIVAAIAIEAATYRVATLVIHRERPDVPRLDDLPVNASYYSGHTAASIAVYGGLALLVTSSVRNGWVRAACWSVALAIPLLVAFSRMYRGMHHPTDVAAAALVGIGTLVVAVAAARAADAAARPGSAER